MVPDAEKLDSVYLSNKQMLKSYPGKNRTYDICKNGYMLFTFDDNDLECFFCHSPCYKDLNNTQAAATMDYLPLSEQLEAMLLSKKYRDTFQQTYEREEDDIYYTDIFDGQQFKQHEHLFPGKFDTACALYVDGFSPFKKRGLNGAVSMTIVHIIILNLPSSERYKLHNMLTCCIIPGPLKPRSTHSFLAPLFDELASLSTNGMIIKMDGEPDIHLHLNLLLATRDFPGIADMVFHSGHSSVFGCHICRIESSSQLSPNGLGNDQYFPGGIGLEMERTLEEFQGKLRDYGIYDGTPFGVLPSFKNAFFMGCDEMHLLQNISRQLIDMFNTMGNSWDIWDIWDIWDKTFFTKKEKESKYLSVFCNGG
ncbi:hypothetical protein INT45_001100, partial [Circinella minor]